MTFSRPIVDVIRARASWRSYTEQPIAEDTLEQLRGSIADPPPAPFGSTVRLGLLQAFDARARGVHKLGTYGVIKGASNYLVGAVQSGPRAMEDYGYLFEWLILQATDLGLASCWLGGFFQRGAFGQAIEATEHELLPAVSPVGHARSSRSLIDRSFRLIAGSKKRKPWDQLFFAPDGSALTPEAAGDLAEALEMLRLGPSASNQQPWRLVMDRERGQLALYLVRTPAYQGRFGVDLQRVDMGIAMSHLDLTAGELGIPGRWTEDAGPRCDALDAAEFVASWRPD